MPGTFLDFSSMTLSHTEAVAVAAAAAAVLHLMILGIKRDQNYDLMLISVRSVCLMTYK